MNPTPPARISQHIKASRAEAYRALLEANAVATWMVPDGMTSRIHEFDACEGGTFRISLTYDANSEQGKSGGQTDTYHGHFVRLEPNKKVVQAMAFESDDATMRGEMTVTFTLREVNGGTEVSAVHENLPLGISPADNETGWRMSLEKLARLVETG